MDYYMANLAAEVRRTIAKNPRTVSLKDFLLRFKFGKKNKKKKVDHVKQGMDLKSFFMGWLKPKGK